MTIDPTTRELRQLLTPPAHDEDASIERLRARLAKSIAGPDVTITPARRSARRPALVLSAMSVAAITGVGVAAAAGVVDLPGFSHQAAHDTPSLAESDRPMPSDLERAMLRQVVADITDAPRDPGVDYGPTLAELPSLETSRLLLDSGQGRVAAIASTRGDVCTVYTFDDEVNNATCFTEFERDLDITLAHSTNGVSGTQLYGLAKDSVASIDVLDRDGSATPAAVEGNAWAWRGDAKTSPTTVLIHKRDGSELRRPIVARADLEVNSTP
jgi:hypothetical protein